MNDGSICQKRLLDWYPVEKAVNHMLYNVRPLFSIALGVASLRMFI
jgi:hypothetical protein